ncbi:MAG: hypothetical protein GY859_42285, partial [Desulfobacterales bacterium]|nr:hypothetical protein [Desulfobacterales bacterium]
RDAAFLYGVNTAGAVLGAFLAGFLLIKHLGCANSVQIAAGLNFFVAAVALLAYFRAGGADPAAPPGAAGPRGAGPRGAGPGAAGVRGPRFGAVERPGRAEARLTLLCLGVSGFCALAWQVLWTRLLIPVVDNSVYSFAIILMGFLLGLALGSLLIASLARWVKKPVILFALVEIAVGVSAFMFPFFIHLKSVDVGIPYWEGLLLKLPLALLAPTVLMGAAFPLGAWIYGNRIRMVGRGLGRAFAVNTLGGVAGAGAAAIFMITALGFRKSFFLLSVLIMVAGWAVLAARVRRAVAGAAFAGLVILVVIGARVMPENFFAEKYGRLEEDSKLIYYKEGMAASAGIFQRTDGNRVLYLNGIPEVDVSLLSVKTFKLLGALPGMLHPDPSNALMVTFGAGVTAGASALFADTVDCVDLVDQARDISSFFDRVNDRVLDKKGVSIHVDDARHFLGNTDKRYAFIVSDATHPRTYDSWILFTRQFYELVRGRLDKNGVFCQWLPFHGLPPERFRDILRTFSRVFPHASVWRIGPAYCILLGAPGTLSIDFGDFYRKLRREEVRRSLKGVGLDNPFAFLACFSMGEKQIAEITAGSATILTDDSPAHVYFSAGASLEDQHRRWPGENFRLLKAHEASVTPFLVNRDFSEARWAKILAMVRRWEARGD